MRNLGEEMRMKSIVSVVVACVMISELASGIWTGR